MASPPVLPQEILYMIAESLLPLSRDPQRRLLSYLDYGAPVYHHGTLASLCLVSTAFRDFATPVLYRFPMTLDKATSLARTLIERPDLCRYVRHLHDDSFNNGFLPERERLGPRFKELEDEAYAYIERRVLEGQVGPLKDEYDDDLLEELRYTRETESDGQVVDSIIVSLLPNLEKLHVSIYYQPVLTSVPPNFLASLTTATVSHGDTELGMRFSYLFYLAEAAPNLSTLVLTTLSETLRLSPDEDERPPELPCFPNVTTLTLDNAILPEHAFGPVMRAFPRLEDLTYAAGEGGGGEEGMLARQVLGAVLAHASGLKALTVDMSERSPFDGGPEDYVWDSRLAAMSNLESLTIDVQTLYPLNGDGDEEFPEDVLVHTLPPSLETFRLSFRTEGGGPYPAPPKLNEQRKASFLRLAVEVPTRFPNLRRVVFTDLRRVDGLSKVRKAFEAAGVAFSVDRL